MMPFSRAWLGLCSVAALAVMLTNCANPLGSSGGGVAPSPSSTPTTTPSPAPCGTMDPTNPNLVLVAMAGGISPNSVGSYPSVFGYGVSDSSFDIPTQSGLIDITAYQATTPLTTQNVVQFFNGEALSSTTLHSAYGFKSSGFPNAYQFPVPVPSPMATTIASGVTWFTGRVATQDATGEPCFSPEFKLSQGTYYFGDYDAYNATGFRGILVVVTPAPGASFARHRPFGQKIEKRRPSLSASPELPR
jgi:hypothetical protein